MKDFSAYKSKLEEEKARLEQEISPIQKPTALNTDAADEGEEGFAMQDFEQNAGVAGELTARLAEVNKALETIADGTYGTCTVCGKEIEEKRLEANPAATTCTADM